MLEAQLVDVGLTADAAGARAKTAAEQSEHDEQVAAAAIATLQQQLMAERVAKAAEAEARSAAEANAESAPAVAKQALEATQMAAALEADPGPAQGSRQRRRG